MIFAGCDFSSFKKDDTTLADAVKANCNVKAFMKTDEEGPSDTWAESALLPSALPHPPTAPDPGPHLIFKATHRRRSLSDGDLANFYAGRRNALRRKPTVLLMGEARDSETVKTALTFIDPKGDSALRARLERMGGMPDPLLPLRPSPGEAQALNPFVGGVGHLVDLLTTLMPEGEAVPKAASALPTAKGGLPTAAVKPRISLGRLGQAVRTAWNAVRRACFPRGQRPSLLILDEFGYYANEASLLWASGRSDQRDARTQRESTAGTIWAQVGHEGGHYDRPDGAAPSSTSPTAPWPICFDEFYMYGGTGPSAALRAHFAPREGQGRRRGVPTVQHWPS
jgi:hypothetical protein